MITTDPALDEAELAASVVDTLLREDYAGLSRHVRVIVGGPVLELPGGRALPLRVGGFLADFVVARSAPLTLDDVMAALEAISDPADADGVAAFGAECRHALAALRLRRRHLPAVQATLHGTAPHEAAPHGALQGAAPHEAAHGAGPGSPWLGPGGSVRYDALAAAMPHPAYPTAACRLGFGDEDSLRYAPEFWPEFELNWLAVPRTAVVAAGRGRPAWWPEMSAVGLPGSLADTHDLLPVHPLTARLALTRAVAEAGLGPSGPGGAGAGGAVVAPGRWLRVRPTLSTRTVAVTDHPRAHLKLPLPVSTLGLRNYRALGPGTLADGALVHRVLATAVARDPGLGELLLADDGDFAHAGHRCLGYLLRQLPDGLGACRIVPIAALLAPADGAGGMGAAADGAGGGLVLDELGRATGRDPLGFFADYCDLLFGLQVRLFARYGIALESHQQNAAVVVGRRSLRLLVKDFDGALINYPRLAAALGDTVPEPAIFADPRLLTTSDDALADVFTTITVHLCAGALAFGMADRGYASRPELLAVVRRALTAALDRYADVPAAKLLRARVLEADRLPGKAMVTAGTLRDSARTGARDINKFYGPGGPNYLRADAQ